MNDPYVILGASPSDSDEEIKRKYRDLVKKYHPDNYANNPLADLAQEKMKEINEAYDAIQKMRERKNASGGSSSSSYSSGSSEFAGVRSAINSGDLEYAERILENATNRNAEWNFLMGCVYYRKGWLDEARRYFQKAVNMEPTNMEYRQALAKMQTSGGVYRPAGYGRGMDACDICACLLCADACCRC